MSMSPVEIRTCGRPTRAGTPCKARISRFEVACRTHATEHDQDVAEAYRRGYDEGREFERQLSAGADRAKIEWLERRIAQLEEQKDKEQRYYEIDGDQVVEVGGYAYRWRGDEPLKVGDEVLLPENWVSRMKAGPGPTRGVVSKLGATHQGSLSFIVGRAPAEPD